MADIVVDGTVKCSWLTTIADISAPTVAELNAGISLETTLMRDGGLSGFKAETADVENTKVAGTFDTVLPGMASFSNTMLRFAKQSGTDTIYDTLTRGTAGYVVIRRSIPRTTAWTAGQEVQVFPATCGQTSWMDAEKNTLDRYEIPTKLSDEPDLRATVAA